MRCIDGSATREASQRLWRRYTVCDGARSGGSSALWWFIDVTLQQHRAVTGRAPLEPMKFSDPRRLGLDLVRFNLRGRAASEKYAALANFACCPLCRLE